MLARWVRGCRSRLRLRLCHGVAQIAPPVLGSPLLAGRVGSGPAESGCP